MPCVDARDEMADLVIYNKSSGAGDFNDYAKFPIGPSCPVSRADSEERDNQFKANIVFELPLTSTAATGSTVKVNGGVKAGENTLWVGSGTFTLEATTYTGPIKSNSGA